MHFDLTRYRLVATRKHGEDGRIPAEIDLHRCIHHGEISCVSKSGDSLCGGYFGTIQTKDRDYTICGEADPLEGER